MGMDVYGNAPTSEVGKYFRANVWSWRPIHHLCETVLKRKLPGWGFNDAAGFTDQAQCDELADKLAQYLVLFPNDPIELESELRVNLGGRFVGRPGGRDPEHGEVTYENSETPYKADPELVQQFIAFLRACGGFEIR